MRTPSTGGSEGIDALEGSQRSPDDSERRLFIKTLGDAGTADALERLIELEPALRSVEERFAVMDEILASSAMTLELATKAYQSLTPYLESAGQVRGYAYAVWITLGTRFRTEIPRKEALKRLRKEGEDVVLQCLTVLRTHAAPEWELTDEELKLVERIGSSWPSLWPELCATFPEFARYADPRSWRNRVPQVLRDNVWVGIGSIVAIIALIWMVMSGVLTPGGGGGEAQGGAEKSPAIQTKEPAAKSQ